MNPKNKFLIIGVILLLINMVFSNGYFLGGSFTGMVSAAGCCEKTEEGGVCLDADANDCNTDYKSSPNDCKDWGVCKLGWCFDSETGYCSSNVPKSECENRGIWGENEPSECEKGCCYLYENTHYTTERTCDIFEGEFDMSVLENQCVFLTGEEGACVDSGGACVFTTDRNCVQNIQGDFSAGRFCFDVSDYKKTDNKVCVDGKKDVYYLDDHGTLAGIAETCTSREETCAISSSGEAACKSLKCYDDENKKWRINGEKWCVYDSYVGEGKDAPGSSHYKFECIEGEIIKNQCGGDLRGEVCAEKKIGGVSQAQCRANLGVVCFGIETKEECEFNSNKGTGIPDCIWQEVDVDRGFNFGACVPKYPQGFQTQTQAEDICGTATFTCTMVQEKKNSFDDWDCKGHYKIDGKTVYGNCECGTKKFAEEMNNLCITLGDCGAYPNYNGRGTDNFNIEGSSIFAWGEKVCNDMGHCEGKTYWIWKDFCEGHGECENGKYVFNEDLKTTWEDYLKVISDKNFVGQNTPEYYLFPDEAGTYGTLDLEDNEGIQTITSDLPSRPGFLKIPMIGILSDIIIGWFFKDYRTKEVTFTCLPWKAPLGGEHCEECNEGDLPCTKNKCESLGTACDLEETTYYEEDPICFNKYADDSKPPKITPGEIESGFDFKSRTNGVSIEKIGSDECITNHNTISFSLETSESAECRYSLERTNFFSEMVPEFKEGNSWSFEHRIEDMPISTSDDYFRMYVRCTDHAGNWNENEYLVEICVSERPDISPPSILRAEPESGSYVAKDVLNKSAKFYLREAAKCRYSETANVKFENMSNYMTCNHQISEEEAPPVNWHCIANFEGLTEEENKFYVRCKDLSNNTMKTDYPYVLKQTKEELRVVITEPQEESEIKREVNINNPLYLRARTSGGVANGEARCSFKFSEAGWKDYFTTTDSTRHEYVFNRMPNGEYEIEVTCEDVAGNKATDTTKFEVLIDKEPPKLVESYVSDNEITITTDEKASCYFRNDDNLFDLENGTAFSGGWEFNHTIQNRAPKMNYYIRCEDLFENEGFVFEVESLERDDGETPQAIRFYKKNSDFVLITDKDAKCYYKNSGCDFPAERGELMSDGFSNMDDGFSKEHYASWFDGETYYVKCFDSWENGKDSEDCTIVVQTF